MKKVEKDFSGFDTLAAEYISTNEQKKDVEARLKSLKPDLETFAKQGEKNAKGSFVFKSKAYEAEHRLSVRKSVSDAHVQKIRNLLGDEAEQYVVRTEVIPDSTLKHLLESGKITLPQFEDLYEEKEVYSLYVKSLKK